MVIIEYFKTDPTGAATEQVCFHITNIPHGGVAIKAGGMPAPEDLQLMHLRQAEAEVELDDHYPATQGWHRAVRQPSGI
jgi:hypothetical protein